MKKLSDFKEHKIDLKAIKGGIDPGLLAFSMTIIYDNPVDRNIDSISFDPPGGWPQNGPCGCDEGFEEAPAV